MLYLYDNPFSSTDILSIVGESEYSTFNCFSQMKERKEKEKIEGVDADNEIKVLLIGEGNVGKSCFVQRLVFNRFEREWKSTQSISLEQFDIKKNKHCPELDSRLSYILNLWDFGGQDIYHATHRLFMQSQAIYLLFWDAETEKSLYTPTPEGESRKYPVHRLPYWLSYATSQGEGSPILVIHTKTGKYGKEIAPNQNSLEEEYKNVQGFLHVESKENDWDKNGYEDILFQIQKQAKRIKQKSKILTSFIEIREHIRSLQSEKQKTLDLETFLSYVEKKGYLPTNAITPTHVLNWLVQTGVVFYRKGLFENKIILNQEWIISAIYTLFDRTNPYSYYFIKEKNGRFSGKELSQIWNENSESEKELFVSFMKSCELCFETTPKSTEEERYKTVNFEERTFVAPQMLPDKEEDYFWSGRECLYVRYRQGFMHKGTVESFIFRSQEKYSTQTIKLWNSSIRLKTDKNEFAEVERINDQELQIRITPNAKDLLDKIRNLIDEIIHKEITELVSADGEEFVSLNRLEKTDISQNKTILSENDVPIEIEKLYIFLNQDKQNIFELNKQLNSTPMQDPNPTNPNNGGSNTYVTVNPVFTVSPTISPTITSTNNNTNSQTQQLDFKQFVNTLENLQRNFRNLQRDIDEVLEEDSDNKELQKAKKYIEKTIEAAEIVEIEAKNADEGNEEAKSSIKKDKAGFFYYVGKVGAYFPKLAQAVTNPKNWQNAKESLEAAQAMGGQLGL